MADPTGDTVAETTDATITDMIAGIVTIAATGTIIGVETIPVRSSVGLPLARS
jgi:hypothetical protein